MPLVRYEIRNEHSLANPQLYRTAAKDDPEGLLEGVAMAGLVGIVRQLGDLAEFAAEVFRDLHEEVMATASRGHDLFARVQQLEAEMPAVEKALLSETNQLRFAYTPGVEWHASIRNDQNHCTQGDLPRFIRSSYEECRGPPRLFLLDKFDVAGAGACLKRYTDPSFFRTEWASSELMKAERVQRDKKARREKKKGRRRRNVDGKESILAEQYQSTFSHELSRELSNRNQAHSRMGHPSHSEVSKDSSLLLEDTNQSENLNALSRHLADSQVVRQDVIRSSNISPASTQEYRDNSLDIPEPAVSEDQISSPAKYQTSATAITNEEEMIRERDETGPDLPQMDSLEGREEGDATNVDDGGSEGEQFLDALTTMESEADSDSELHLRQDKDADNMRDSPESQPISQEDVLAPGMDSNADEKMSPSVKQSGTLTSLDLSREEVLPEAGVVVTGHDVKGTSCLPTAIHARRQSSDSMSSIISRKGKQVQVLEEPSENFRSSSETFRISKDGKGATEPSDQGPLFSFNSGVKVSKMVAAFERGSLEEVQAEEIEKEGPNPSIVLHTGGPNADAAHEAIEEPGNVGVSEGHTVERNSSSQSFASPAEGDSPLSQGALLKLDGSRPRSIRVKHTSISSRTSLGSLDSPPDSPTFSAIQSPVSPIRAERNILLSPDRLGFPAETLSPGSPTSVPILAHSPTSQQVRHPAFFSLERGQGQVLGEPFNLTSPSRSTDVSSTPYNNSRTEAPPPLAATIVIDDSPSNLLSLSENSSHLHSTMPTRSLDDSLPAIPLALLPELVSTAQSSLEDSGELDDLLDTAHDTVRISTVKSELDTLPRAEGVAFRREGSLSTSESGDDDVHMASKLRDNEPHRESSKVQENNPPKLASMPTPSASRHDGALLVSDGNQDPSLESPSNHDLTRKFLPVGKHDKVSSTSKRSLESVSHFSRDDFPFITKAGHRRFPSLPLVEKTIQDFSRVTTSESSLSPLEPAMPANAISGAQMSAKFALKAPSSSRTVHDHPYPVRKAAHSRSPSFPSSEASNPEIQLRPLKSLELASTSAASSRLAPVAQDLAPTIPHNLPSQTVGNLPPPTPSSQSERDVPPLPLLPPTPPSKSERDFPPLAPSRLEASQNVLASPLPRLEASQDLSPPPPPPGSSGPLSATKPAVGADVQDGLLEAIASHDKSTLKKVKTMQNPIFRKGDDRSHLLEQIRAQSFNLRHTVVEKVDAPLPRPMTNINVAAILEKANAIRQAFAGSDEDDEDNEDWSDV